MRQVPMTISSFFAPGDLTEADYPDGLPFYYETWYLPAIGAGIPMPDVIGGGSFLAPGEVPDKGMEGQEG